MLNEALFTIVVISQYAATSHKNPYQVIGVQPDASFEEIKRAYRELARTLHPDKGQPSDANASDRFAEINRAYSILKDPEKRRRYGLSLSERIYRRCYNQASRMFCNITSNESFSSIAIIVLCALGGSLIYYQKSSNSSQSNSNEEKVIAEDHESSPNEHFYTDDDLKIIELKAETYNGLVRLLRPGCRSIILLADRETKDILLPHFRKAVWPYRRNKTLNFGYLCLDKNLSWHESLLRQVLCLDDLRIIKRNCVGTVLSLNGFKKYFRMYHAKHTEDKLGDSIFGGDNDAYGDVECGLLGGDETNNTELPVESLLDRLPIWLDKVFDGLTKRYFIDCWPDQIV